MNTMSVNVIKERTLANQSKLKKAVEQDGFCIIKNALSLENLRDLQNTIQYMFSAYAKDSNEDLHAICARLDREDKESLFNIYQYLPKTLAMDKIKLECLPYVKYFYPKGAYVDLSSGILFGLPQDRRLAWNWHQEIHYQPTVENIVHFWFPIFNPSSVENGTMSALRSSHREGPLPYKKIKNLNGSTSLIPLNIEECLKKYDEFYFTAEPGDLAIIDKCLIHKSNFNNSNITRFTGVTRIAALHKAPARADFSEFKD